ncbi:MULTISPECIES: BolA family protein [Pseudovibrio]|uniref:BolA family protein n=1 Tax=Stappiaceae TaxID=2821832 RepID=UPI0023670F95|nr:MULTISPECIES: BolA family protein [Pseudovibrio]MDD7909336.1 BolA family transcriptional regulator [Pseudovibrio exalbescens]MDX5594896.1 BolA family protein [Pseudovibrio sp. SPO723]
MSMKDTIASKLTAEFSPKLLEVIDESHLHAGHAGWREGGETHFRIRIVSTAFQNQNRVAIHRMVNKALADELAQSVHALAIDAKAE